MRYIKTIILKNQKSCVIRNCEATDAKEVYDNFILTHAQTENLLSYPDENSFNIEQEKQYLAKKEISDNEIEICAVVDNKIVGTAGIDAVGHYEKVKHRAECGLAIEKDYWGLGIGRALMAACIENARKAGYSQLELNVIASNTSACSLYKSMGFVEYGRNPKGYRARTAGWQEIVLMRLEL